MPVYPRSAVKSMQATAMVRSGLALKPEQLAVVCASHSGSEEHFRVIKSILADHGLDESAFRNAVDLPLGEAEQRAWGDREPTQLAQNCSGKHAGMLATCVVNGWDLDSYTDYQHPLQVAIKAEFEKLTGESMQYVTQDGCGAPLFAFSIHGLAKAIATIVTSEDLVHRQIVNAIWAYPNMIAGIGRTDTRFMQAVPGLFMKEGAEGVQVAAYKDGRTLVIKVSDGSKRPLAPIVAQKLSEWGLAINEAPKYVYGGGKVVGQVEPR
jgi:L-asparaginase II